MLSPKFVLLSSTLFLAGLPPAVSAENLDDAWRAALSANHRLAAQSESTAAAERQLDSARATRLPTLSIDASYYALDNAPSVRNSMSSVGLPLPGSVTLPIADDHGWVGQAGITQPLYTSGKISNGIRAAEAGLDAARADEGRERLDVKLSVAEAYLDVLRADAAQEVARQYVDSLEHHRRDVQALLDKGLVARADLLQVDVALADARQRRIQADNRVSLSRAAYNRLLDRPLQQPVSLQDMDLPRPQRSLLEWQRDAALKRDELQQLDATRRALTAQAKSQRGDAGPQVGLFAKHLYVQNPYLVNEHINAVGVAVSWTLFDGGLVRNRAAASERQAARAADLKADAESAIALQVQQAWSLEIEADARRGVAQSGVALADESLAIQRDRYANGLATQSDVLDAQARRADARRNLLNARYDHTLAVLRLNRAAGQL